MSACDVIGLARQGQSGRVTSHDCLKALRRRVRLASHTCMHTVHVGCPGMNYSTGVMC